MQGSNPTRMFIILVLTLILTANTASATLNVIIITDPTGKDPNGAAAGSMSFAPNMFQSTFIFSPEQNFAVLSGGSEQNETARLGSIVETIKRLKNNSTAANAASAAGLFKGIRIMAGGPTIGAAVSGDFDAYLVTVAGDGTVTVAPYSNGTAVLPAGTKGAIIHLRHTPENPIGGNVSAVRRDTAIMIGKMIRDGYSATDIMGYVFEKVSIESGEKYGGGAVNLASDITTGDMFTPQKVNDKGFPMNEPYRKTCPTCGWSIPFPSAESYSSCPIDGTTLKTQYAYEALREVIVVQPHTVNVFVYGSEEPGISETTDEIVTASVKKNGFSTTAIASDIDSAINNGLLLGVYRIEPKDINIREDSKDVGVYYKPLPNHRSSPPWDLPISSSVLDIVGNMQTAIGLILVVLVLFRSTLITSILRKKR